MAAPVPSVPPSAWVSLRAVVWVLEEAEKVPAQLVALMIGFARHADEDGRNSFPSHSTLARYTRKTARQVKKDVALAVELGLLIKPVDQSAAAHIRADRRPVVYDLPCAPARPHEGNHTTPRESGKTVNGVSLTTRRRRHVVATGGTGRRVVEGHTGCPPGSHEVSCTTPEEDRTNQEDRDGGTLPPCPPATRADASADSYRSNDPLTAVPDLNDTQQVTSKTRARIETTDRPLMTVIQGECAECGTLLDPDGTCFRCTTWTELAPTITQLTHPPSQETA